MPAYLCESLHPETWNEDPLRNYQAFYSLLDKYRVYREQERLLVGRRVYIAAQRILDIDEDIKESYGGDTADLNEKHHGFVGAVACALNQYRRNIRMYGWALEPRVLEHAQRLVEEGRESDEIEERQRLEMLSCRSSFEAARSAMISHLTSYVASIRRYNSINSGPAKPVGRYVLAAVKAVSRWAEGDTRRIATYNYLRSQNLRNWGNAGYTAKIVSIYYWALRKTKGEVDGEVLLAVNDVMKLVTELGERCG
ncbi:hypothetical protein BKA65DRAFT_474036 [Rhexocercosporidium sp. MPI-PUGE-AT-0058]|nr:hypothetical protein BKA65DRAFT_474036 [Rhexocercosporidium sp. MPI-PUGE-AT-0058]